MLESVRVWNVMTHTIFIRCKYYESFLRLHVHVNLAMPLQTPSLCELFVTCFTFIRCNASVNCFMCLQTPCIHVLFVTCFTADNHLLPSSLTTIWPIKYIKIIFLPVTDICYQACRTS